MAVFVRKDGELCSDIVSSSPSALLADKHTFTISISYGTTRSRTTCPNDLERKFNEEMQKAGLLGITFIACQ